MNETEFGVWILTAAVGFFLGWNFDMVNRITSLSFLQFMMIWFGVNILLFWFFNG